MTNHDYWREQVEYLEKYAAEATGIGAAKILALAEAKHLRFRILTEPEEEQPA